MKLQFLFLLVICSFSSSEGKSPNNIGPEVVFKATLNGSYHFNESTCHDPSLYFLFQCELINNSDSTIHFVTHSCATYDYIITDNKDINACMMNCTGNFRTRITLEPNQSFSFPIILKTTSQKPNKIKLGWVFLTHHEQLDLPEYNDALRKSKTKLRNIIWSDQIELLIGNGTPYSISSGK